MYILFWDRNSPAMPFCILGQSLPLSVILCILLANLPTMSQIWLVVSTEARGLACCAITQPLEWGGGGSVSSRRGKWQWLLQFWPLCQHCPWWATVLVNLVVSVSPQEKLLPFLGDQWGLIHFKIYIYFIYSFLACGILVPQPGIKPVPLHWKCSFNHWTTREVPESILKKKTFYWPWHVMGPII